MRLRWCQMTFFQSCTSLRVGVTDRLSVCAMPKNSPVNIAVSFLPCFLIAQAGIQSVGNTSLGQVALCPGRRPTKNPCIPPISYAQSSNISAAVAIGS